MAFQYCFISSRKRFSIHLTGNYFSSSVLKIKSQGKVKETRANVKRKINHLFTLHTIFHPLAHLPSRYREDIEGDMQSAEDLKESFFWKWSPHYSRSSCLSLI